MNNQAMNIDLIVRAFEALEIGDTIEHVTMLDTTTTNELQCLNIKGIQVGE